MALNEIEFDGTRGYEQMDQGDKGRGQRATWSTRRSCGRPVVKVVEYATKGCKGHPSPINRGAGFEFNHGVGVLSLLDYNF